MRRVSRIAGWIRLSVLAMPLVLLASGLCAASTYPARNGGTDGASIFSLSDEEKEFLEEHPSVRMCADPDWLPYDKLDSQGRHVGMFADYHALFRARIGIEVEMVPTKTWKECLELVKNKQCDLISGLNESRERNRFLGFTVPFMRARTILVTRNENGAPRNFSDMGGRTLATIRGYLFAEKIRADYPEVKLTYVENYQEGLRGVVTGVIDAAAGPEYILLYWIEKLGFDNLRVAGEMPYQSLFRVGVRNDWPELFMLYNKAVKSLTGEDHAVIRRAYAPSGDVQ